MSFVLLLFKHSRWIIDGGGFMGVPEWWLLSSTTMDDVYFDYDYWLW